MFIDFSSLSGIYIYDVYIYMYIISYMYIDVYCILFTLNDWIMLDIHLVDGVIFILFILQNGKDSKLTSPRPTRCCDN